MTDGNPFQGGLFDGSTFRKEIDGKRLAGQGLRVYQLLRDVGYKNWLTLAEIAKATGAPEASVSARLRDLRKSKFGGHTVERRRHPEVKGLHQYRLRTEA